MLRSADVAKMLPCVPAAMTATEATNTMKSAGGEARSRPASGSEVGAGGPGAVGRGGGRIGRVRRISVSSQGLGRGVNPGAWGQGSSAGGQGLSPMTQKGFLAKRKRPCHPR